MEPGTPQPQVTLGNQTVTLAWTKRSEALLSKHAFDPYTLAKAMSRPREGFHALCLGVYAAMPPERAPTDYLDLAEPLSETAAQVAAFTALGVVMRNAYPAVAAEKKSASKSSSPGRGR